MRISVTTKRVPGLGRDLAKQLSQRSIELYTRGAEYASGRGIIIADTKFEFGLVDDELILIDEVLTPDSSRFWPADDTSRAAGSRRTTSNSCAIG